MSCRGELPWRTGRMAALQGRPRSANCYEHSTERGLWLDGYEEGLRLIRQGCPKVDRPAGLIQKRRTHGAR